MTAPSTRLCHQRAIRGDPSALAELLERYGAMVYGLCLAHADDADDAYQAAWEHVLTRLARFDPEGPARLSTWIYRVTHNHLVDRRRASRRRAAEPLAEEPAVASGIEEAIGARQRQVRLRAALAELPDAQRRAIVHHYLDELPLSDVAELEGVPVGTIKSRLHHGRCRLLELLGRPS